ncbi:MAG: arylsulfatase [Nitrospirota bacterium]|nr:MAG: arylsulfatase [Nitrospirota bacterium]
MQSSRFVLIAILALVVGISHIAQTEAADKRPNILLVMADDMGWTDLGSFGSEIDTPNLDALAQRGVKFTEFYVSVSCSPTRSMLLSGTDNHLAGLGNMGEMIAPEQRGKPGYEGYLNDRVVSLAEVLRDGGYHTYMAGKWHLGKKPNRYPHARGFDRSFSLLLGGASYWSDMFGMMAELEPMAEYVMDDTSLERLPGDFFATRSYTDFLIDAIRQNRSDGKPFLAYLAFTAPHDPMHVPEPWRSRYRGHYDEGYEVLKAQRARAAKRMGLVSQNAQLPERFHMVKAWDSLSEEQRALESRGMEVYAGMVNNMDYHFGRMVSFLKDIGEYENTIIIFLSDNGPNPWVSEDYPSNRGSQWFAQFDNSIKNIGHPMSHYAYGMGWSSASSGPLDLFKMTVGEGGIRSPLLIGGPGVKGGRQFDGLAYVWDVMPTILEFAGIPYPEKHQGRQVEPMRGRSLKGLLSGSSVMVYDEHDFIGGEMQNGKWMRQGAFKAVSVAPPYGKGNWQLYNLADDPGETRDLATEQADKLKQLQAAWDQYAKEVGVILTN